MIFAPPAIARASSSAVWTSTTASIPNSRPRAIRSTNCLSRSAATISRKLSASFARVSQICQGSKMKSLRNTGNLIFLRASRRFFSEPRKNSPSVSTESAAAPASSSAAPSATASKGSRIMPRDGDAGFSSAIILIPGLHKAEEKSRSGVAALTPYFSAVSGRTFLRCSTSSRRASRMRSRTVPV